MSHDEPSRNPGQIGWKVHYIDGTTVDSTVPVPEVPTRGVLCVVQLDDEVGRLILSGHDYYVYRPETPDGPWYGVFDNFGLWDYLAADGLKKVLFGRTAPTAMYRETYSRALDDPDFPPKSAFDGEREQERERPPGISL